MSVKNFLLKLDHSQKNIIHDLKKSDTWKIQLTITINFISFKNDNDEERVIHSKSQNI